MQPPDNGSRTREEEEGDGPDGMQLTRPRMLAPALGEALPDFSLTLLLYSGPVTPHSQEHPQWLSQHLGHYSCDSHNKPERKGRQISSSQLIAEETLGSAGGAQDTAQHLPDMSMLPRGLRWK